MINQEFIKVINQLQENINFVPAKFLKYPEVELTRKPAPDKWSRKEILGHLIDSAANNHHRFVKAQSAAKPFLIDDYEQDQWVQVQNYNEKNTNDLVYFWEVYNKHILYIMKNTPEESLRIELNAEDPFEKADNLFLLMKDYVDHMDHHLKKIFKE